MSRQERSTGARAGVGLAEAQEPSTGDDAVAYAAC